MLAGIDDPEIDSTAFHTSSSSHSRVICHPGNPAPMIMGGLVLWLQCDASFTSTVVFRWSTVTAVSEPSVSAVVSVTAITGLQLRRRNQKNWFRSVSRGKVLRCLANIIYVYNATKVQNATMPHATRKALQQQNGVKIPRYDMMQTSTKYTKYPERVRATAVTAGCYTLCLKKTGHLRYFQISPTKLDQYQ